MNVFVKYLADAGTEPEMCRLKQWSAGPIQLSFQAFGMGFHSIVYVGVVSICPYASSSFGLVVVSLSNSSYLREI